jgi:hypothetical protein
VNDDQNGRSVAWGECDAYARSYCEETGRERELVCSLGVHSTPGDITEDHYDEDLDVWWRYADGGP